MTIDEAPERIVTIKSSATEMVLALVLGDTLVGAAYLDGPLRPELAASQADLPILSDRVPGQEAVLGTGPDLVYAGWESNFSAGGAAERDSLDDLGVPTYVSPSACKAPGYQPGPLTFEDVFADITEAGQVLGARAAADALVAEQRAALAAVTPDTTGLTALWYSSCSPSSRDPRTSDRRTSGAPSPTGSGSGPGARHRCQDAIVWQLRLPRVLTAAAVGAGLAVAQLAAAATSFVIFWSSTGDSYREILGWLMGALGGATWTSLLVPGGAVLVLGTALVAAARTLDAFAFGDVAAAALGLHVPHARWSMLTGVALLTGALMAVSGSIGFSGFVFRNAMTLRVDSAALEIRGRLLLDGVDCTVPTGSIPRPGMRGKPTADRS